MDLRPNLFAPARRGRLYGTPPPRAGTPPGQVAAAAEKLAARLAGLPLDAVVVYDIQDETGRTGLPRPFPLIATLDPRDYAKFFSVPTIVYKALGDVDEAGWTAWLDASRGRDFLSIVGRPAPGKYALPLSRAIPVGAARPLARSIRICRDNLRRILDGKYADQIPLGVNVESVSINRDEIDASVELFHALGEVLQGK